MATNVMCMCLARICVTGSGPLGGGRGSYRGPICCELGGAQTGACPIGFSAKLRWNLC